MASTARNRVVAPLFERADPKEDASLEKYLERRKRGWVERADRPKAAPVRLAKAKRPQVSRYVKLQKELESSLFNGSRHWVDTTKVRPGKRSIRCVDLFSGCGGMTLGFEMAGFESVLGVEMDPDAAATYRRNFPKATVWPDRVEELSDAAARSIVGRDPLPVLLAGFPCQGFSVAGKRDPSDPRNSLFKQVLRFARLFEPSFVVMENVPGVMTMAGGRVVQDIREGFAELGYENLSILILEAAAYGVPQFRPRAIFVANRLGISNPFPAPALKPEDYVPIEEAIADLKDVPRDPSINHDWTFHSPEMEKRLSRVPPGGSLYETYFDAWKRQYAGVPCMTIKENHGGTHVHYELDRTLSAREMARLQSFPDSFKFEGRMKRVMFQVGNAVPPELARHVALALRTALDTSPARVHSK